MKKVSFLLILGVIGILAVSISAGAGGNDSKNKAKDHPGKIDWEIPIAPGVWYPGSGPLPDKPMRYYRVRCFPGCHTGSKYGAFPDTPLKGDRPIFPTSTINHIQNDKTGKKSGKQ